MKVIFAITILLVAVVIVKQQKKIDALKETIEYQNNKLNKRQQYQHKAKQFVFKQPKRK